jgi:hypothetical protein
VNVPGYPDAWKPYVTFKNVTIAVVILFIVTNAMWYAQGRPIVVARQGIPWIWSATLLYAVANVYSRGPCRRGYRLCSRVQTPHPRLALPVCRNNLRNAASQSHRRLADMLVSPYGTLNIASEFIVVLSEG